MWTEIKRRRQEVGVRECGESCVIEEVMWKFSEESTRPTMWAWKLGVALTVFVDEQRQMLAVAGADVQQQSRALGRPEAQRDVLSSQGQVRVHGRGQSAAVSDALKGLLEGVAEGRF